MFSVLLDMVTSVQAGHAPSLRAGSVLNASVEGTPGNLAAVSGSLRVPLPDTAPFQPRQPVLIEVRDSPQGLQLLVRPAPQSTPPQPPQSPQNTGFAEFLRAVAAALEAVNVPAAPDVAAQTVPASLPRSQPALAQFFAPYAAATAGALADDWAALAQLLAQAVAGGAVSRKEAGLSDTAARGANFENASTIEAALLQAADDAVPLEARIAAALASDDSRALDELFSRSPRALLNRLRQFEPFQAFLRDSGQSQLFDGLAERILSRLSDAGVQNVRSLDQPYVFMQLAVPPGGPFQRANIHVASGGRPGDLIDPRNASIAFDLETARLGDLWITLATDGSRCACRFRARSAEAVEAISAAVGDLAASLKQAGYARATVDAVLWDGDRLGALAAFARPFRGLDEEA